MTKNDEAGKDNSTTTRNWLHHLTTNYSDFATMSSKELNYFYPFERSPMSRADFEILAVGLLDMIFRVSGDYFVTDGQLGSLVRTLDQMVTPFLRSVGKEQGSIDGKE